MLCRSGTRTGCGSAGHDPASGFRADRNGDKDRLHRVSQSCAYGKSSLHQNLHGSSACHSGFELRKPASSRFGVIRSLRMGARPFARAVRSCPDTRLRAGADGAAGSRTARHCKAAEPAPGGQAARHGNRAAYGPVSPGKPPLCASAARRRADLCGEQHHQQFPVSDC